MDHKTAFIVDRLNELAHDIEDEYRLHWCEDEVLNELKTPEERRTEAMTALKEQGVTTPIHKHNQIEGLRYEGN